MSKFVIGDAVTLARAAAGAFMRRRSVVRRLDKSFKWQQRKGHVAWITANKTTIGVRWEGRKGVDPLPPRALVRCTDY
jgi:hypothetical protein